MCSLGISSYLQGRHADDLVRVVEESGQDIEYGSFRKYQFLWEAGGATKQKKHEQVSPRSWRVGRGKAQA